MLAPRTSPPLSGTDSSAGVAGARARSPAAALEHLHVDGRRLGHAGQRLLQVAHRLVHGAAAAGSSGDPAGACPPPHAARRHRRLTARRPRPRFESAARRAPPPDPEALGSARRRAGRGHFRPRRLLPARPGDLRGARLAAGQGRGAVARLLPGSRRPSARAPPAPPPWAKSTRSTRPSGARRTRVRPRALCDAGRAFAPAGRVPGTSQASRRPCPGLRRSAPPGPAAARPRAGRPAGQQPGAWRCGVRLRVPGPALCLRPDGVAGATPLAP